MPPRVPQLVVFAFALSACHKGERFVLPDAPPHAEVDAGEAGQPDTPDAGADAAGDAQALDAPGDARALAEGDGAAPEVGVPSQACPPPSPPEMCVFGSARCGGGECIPLNTEQNCGRCGRTCGDSVCQGMECEQLLVPTSAGVVRSIAVNDSAVIWSNKEGDILARPLAGGTTRPLGAHEGSVLSMAADDRFVFFMNKEGDSCPQGGCLWRLALDLSSRDQIADVGSYPGGLALDADYVYWFTGGAIRRLKKVGETMPQTIAQLQGSDVGLAIDEQFVYWASDQSGEGIIKRAPKDGSGSPSAVAHGLKRPLGVAVDRFNVYWTDAGTRSIQWAPKQGGTPATLASHSHMLQEPVNIAVSDTDVYWSLSGGNVGLYKIPRCGGETRYIEAGGVGNIVVSKGIVYWASDAGVFRMAQ